MGFTALCSDGKGHYWFRSIHSFHGAVSTSLESLEDLVDSARDSLEGGAAKQLGKTYRRLENMLV